jgi:hypothetical protein
VRVPRAGDLHRDQVDDAVVGEQEALLWGPCGHGSPASRCSAIAAASPGAVVGVAQLVVGWPSDQAAFADRLVAELASPDEG